MKIDFGNVQSNKYTLEPIQINDDKEIPFRTEGLNFMTKAAVNNAAQKILGRWNNKRKGQERLNTRKKLAGYYVPMS